MSQQVERQQRLQELDAKIDQLREAVYRGFGGQGSASRFMRMGAGDKGWESMTPGERNTWLTMASHRTSIGQEQGVKKF